MPNPARDGISGMLPRAYMPEHVRRFRDFIDCKPNAPLVMREFGFYCLEKWQREEGLPQDVHLDSYFGFDENAVVMLGGCGGCEAAFEPEFPVEILEDRGEHEVVQDKAGRHVLYFKGRRDGFMPEYLTHPVTDQESFEEKCLWRMNPATPARYEKLSKDMPQQIALAQKGYVVEAYVVGGYMYLRSLMGAENLLFAFYDDPKLIHQCMQAWFNLTDAVLAWHQQHISIDFLLLDEDICYNHGPLISPDMIKEFLMPYYQQLLANARARRLDAQRPIYYHLASDGFVDPVIDLYRQMGTKYLSPFEVAAGSDVVACGRRYPDLIISGGLDKRIMAGGKEAIDKMLQDILPVMKERGGYMPTCDHGVPEEVKLSDYLYMRQKMRTF